MTLANISFNYDGKEQIIAKGYIKSLCGYVSNGDEFVRRETCLLLCSLAQLNQGKIEILNFCPFEKIVDRLSDQLSDTVLNAVQLIANLAEHPLGRNESLKIIDKIEKINCIERKYVNATLDVIRWKPWFFINLFSFLRFICYIGLWRSEYKLQMMNESC